MIMASKTGASLIFVFIPKVDILAASNDFSFFVWIPDILALQDGFRVSFASAGRVSRQGRADEIKTVNISSSKAACASVSQDSRPVQKSWNARSFFEGSPPVRATRNGRIGRWKAYAGQLASRLYKDFKFIQGEEPDMRKSSSKKRRASGVIYEV
jgi:hypothetical protein